VDLDSRRLGASCANAPNITRQSDLLLANCLSRAVCRVPAPETRIEDDMGDPAGNGLQPTPGFNYKYQIDPALAPLLAQSPQPGLYNRYRLFDGQLRLDPELMASFSDTMSRLRAQSAQNDFLRPNWKLFGPELDKFFTLPPPNLLAPPPGLPAMPPPAPGYTPGKGPDVARAGKMSDLMEAIWKLQPVQTLAGRARDEGMRQLHVFERDWDKFGTVGKIGFVSASSVIAGGIIAPLMFLKSPRGPVLDPLVGLIDGKDIPIPKLDGFKVKLMFAEEKTPKGAGIGVTVPLAGGVSAGASVRGYGPGADVGLTISWDLMQVLPGPKPKSK
jgi:hypothetical protein